MPAVGIEIPARIEVDDGEVAMLDAAEAGLHLVEQLADPVDRDAGANGMFTGAQSRTTFALSTGMSWICWPEPSNSASVCVQSNVPESASVICHVATNSAPKVSTGDPRCRTCRNTRSPGPRRTGNCPACPPDELPSL